MGTGKPWSCAVLARSPPPGALGPPRVDTPHHVVVDLHQGCGCVEAAQVRVLQALGFPNMVSEKSLPRMRHNGKQNKK